MFFAKEGRRIAYRTDFTFIGKPIFPNEKSTRPFVRKWKGGENEDLEMASINFGIKAGNSIGYVELFGMKSETIYTMNTDNERTEIPWAERNEAKTIGSIASYRKHYITLDDGLREFIAPYDVICHLEENLKSVSGQVRVTGTMEKEPYVSKDGTERFQDRFIIQNVKAVADTEKPRLSIDIDLFYNKGMVDKSDFKPEKKITVDGYVCQYLRKTKSINRIIEEAGQEVFIPQRAVLSAGKFDMDNDLHKKIVASRVDELTVQSSKKLYHCRWRCSLVSGAEEVEFDESQLTPKQKRQIELGESTLEDFRPKGTINGPRIYEMRLVKPLLKGDFADGVVEADVTLKEFEDSVIKFKKAEDFEAIVENANPDNGSAKQTGGKDPEEEVPFATEDEDLLEDWFNE